MKYLGANETQSLISIVRGGKTEDSLYHKQSQSQLLWEWIVKFHIIVSEGPLYICSCCDKFWYKHAVSSATNITLKYPDIQNYFFLKKVKKCGWYWKIVQIML